MGKSLVSCFFETQCRSPNSTQTDDTNLCKEIECLVGDVKKDIIIVGDFNFPEIDRDSCYSVNKSFGSTAILNTIHKLLLLQHNYQKLSDDVIRTRGTKYKLIQHHCCYDLWKFNFTNRVIPIWNSLSNHAASADTVNCFNNRLDKFWSNQEVLYNHKADLRGTGIVIVLVQLTRLTKCIL